MNFMLVSVKTKGVSSQRKLNFTPNQRRQNRGMDLKEFLVRLEETASDAVILYERSGVRRESTVTEDNIPSDVPMCPPSLEELAATSQDTASFLAQLKPLTLDDVCHIQVATRGQADSMEWAAQRKGRITASLFRDVHTRVNTIKKAADPNTVDTTSLIVKLCQYKTPNDDLWQLKHGRNMESEAAEMYTKHHKIVCGANVKASSCGLVVDAQNPFIGASPDKLISCAKCGDGLVEIKCPATIAWTKPTCENVKWLEVGPPKTQICNNCTVRGKLSRSYKYYDQIQGQLALTGRQWCDLWVYTRHGHHVE
jgi:hypothetical protein